MPNVRGSLRPFAGACHRTPDPGDGGDIHSIEFGDDTFFLRVTGGDVETKETHRFDVDKKTVEIANRALGQR